MNRDNATAIVQRWKTEGRTIALASGGFDLFHAGHVSFLLGLSEQADMLVVAIMSDVLLRKKGQDRPIIPEDQRSAIVSALRCVDIAFLFDEFGDERNLELIRPDIFGRGDGHTATMFESEIIEKLGIKIALIHSLRITSTTAIIERIKHEHA